MSYKFDRVRVPPTRGQAFPSDIASGIKHSAGGLLLPGSMPSRRYRPLRRFYLYVCYRYFDGFPVLSADRVE